MSKRRYTFALLGMLFMPGAHAEAADMRPYLGVGLGVFGLEYTEPGVTQKNNVFGGFIKGGLDINDYFGVEMRIGATDNGKTTYPAGFVTGSVAPTTVAQSFDSFVSLLAKLQYPVSPDMRLYAMLGSTSATYKQTYTPVPPGFVASQSVTKAGLSYGVGFEADINDSFFGGLEWMQYWTNVKLNTTGTKMKMWGATASVSYGF